MHPFLSTLLICVIPVFILIMVAYYFGLRWRRNDLADVVWGLGFIVIAWTGAIAGGHLTTSWTVVLVNLLVTIWGLRLAYHIGQRFRHSKQEDKRYQEQRQGWGKDQAWHSLINVFLPQGALMLVVSLPVTLVNANAPATAGWLVWVGMLIWLFGFIYEATGDRQLKGFLNDPTHRGQIMMAGLWQYSRHPNYFGEVTQWWGLAIVALSVPYGWIGLLGAATITYLITRVSGVPLAEASMNGRPEWEAYKRHTPALIPWPRRRIH
jgi:steroid 5-alpha reductase family enzyme